MDLAFASDIGNQGLVIELLGIAEGRVPRPQSKSSKASLLMTLVGALLAAGEALCKPGASYNFDLFG